MVRPALEAAGVEFADGDQPGVKEAEEVSAHYEVGVREREPDLGGGRAVRVFRSEAIRRLIQLGLGSARSRPARRPQAAAGVS